MTQASEIRSTTIGPVGGSLQTTGLLRRATKGFGKWVRILRRRAALAEELYRLDDRAMADLGLRRSEIPLVVRSYPDTPDLLRRMVRRVGLDFEALRKQPPLLRRLERACVTCWFRRECRWWLQCHDGKNGYRAFCPNTEDFDSLRFQRRMGTRLSPR